MRLRLALAVFGLSAAVAAGAAWLGTELVMAPAGAERTRLISMFVAITAAVVVVGIGLLVVTRNSIHRRILAVGIAGPAVVALITLIGAQSMFISEHDTQFVIILTALAGMLAVALVQLLSGRLLNDLNQISSAAKQFASGDFTARADLDRSDELGSLGTAFDDMAQRLAESKEERERVEEQRRFMLSSLSHDARTPLTAMRAAVEALQDGMAPDPTRYLASIEHDLRSIEAIVENIFLIGKLESQQLAPLLEQLDLSTLVHRSIEALSPLAERKNVRLHVQADPDVVVVAGAVETERIIANLVSNAFRHSPPGGDVVVEVRDWATPTLVVRDDGPGFPPDFVATAFEQFARAEPARDRALGGAGLGLAVVRGLSEAMGGRAWALPGPGGKVLVELPRAV